VVVGSSHIATNEMFEPGMQARVADAYFVTAAIGWLTERRELVEIPPRPASAAALNASASDIRWVQLYAVLLVPLAAALIGLAVWRSRKAS
jgi:hypothetical protein